MLGSFLDPFADKLLVATLFGTLTYANLMPSKLLIVRTTTISKESILMILVFRVVSSPYSNYHPT